MMTDQEAFNSAVLGVVAQGKPALCLKIDQCQYRAGGLKCAVGMLIPDDDYQPKFDERSWSTFELVQTVPAMRGLNDAMLNDLQGAHDDAAMEKNFVETFLIRAEQVASAYGLTMPEIVR